MAFFGTGGLKMPQHDPNQPFSITRTNNQQPTQATITTQQARPLAAPNTQTFRQPAQVAPQFKMPEVDANQFRMSTQNPQFAPLSQTQMQQYARDIANMQTQPQLQEIDRQLSNQRLNARQSIDELTGPAFQSLMGEMDRAQQKGFSAAAQRANERGMLFSPLGRGEFRDVEEAFANQRGRVVGEQAFGARQIGQRTDESVRQLDNRKLQLSQAHGLLQSQAQMALRDSERAAAMGDWQSAQDLKQRAQAMGLQAMGMQEEARRGDNALGESQFQFDSRMGEDKRQFNALEPFREQQTRQARLTADRTNSDNFIRNEFRTKYGFAPEEAELYASNLQNQAVKLQLDSALGRIDSSTPEAQQRMAQIEVLKAQAQSMRDNARAALMKKDVGTDLNDNLLSSWRDDIYQRLRDPGLSGDEKADLVEAYVQSYMQKTGAPRDQALKALVGDPKRLDGLRGQQSQVDQRAAAEQDKLVKNAYAKVGHEWAQLLQQTKITKGMNAEDVALNEEKRQEFAARAEPLLREVGKTWKQFMSEYATEQRGLHPDKVDDVLVEAYSDSAPPPHEGVNYYQDPFGFNK